VYHLDIGVFQDEFGERSHDLAEERKFLGYLRGRGRQGAAMGTDGHSRERRASVDSDSVVELSPDNPCHVGPVVINCQGRYLRFGKGEVLVSGKPLVEDTDADAGIAMGLDGLVEVPGRWQADQLLAVIPVPMCLRGGTGPLAPVPRVEVTALITSFTLARPGQRRGEQHDIRACFADD